jgi:hypothetical protein
MYQPKQDLYELLSTLENVVVYQIRPEVLKELPCITFQVANNAVNATLDKDIGYQRIQFNIDVWTKTSSEGSTLLSTLEELLRGNGYLLESATDVIDPDAISHIATRFNLVE